MKHETLGNISHLGPDLIDMVQRSFRGEIFVSASDSVEIARSLPHGHVAAVLGTIRKLGLDRLLSRKPIRERELVLAMIVSRILKPSSKPATSRGLAEKTVLTTLTDILGVESAHVNELYRALDWLVTRQESIEHELAKRHFSEGALVLYDVTSVYFEGRKCPLARRGYNRDKKKGKLQIVVGLLCNRQGCPVAVEVFEGNTGDSTTLASQIEKVKSQYGLSKVILVGDRGMITETRLTKDIRIHEGLDWITCLRAPKVKALARSGKLQLSLFDKRDLAEITHPDFPGERLILCRNPFLAAERARKREELLQATEEKLAAVAQATTRPKRRLKGKDKIALRVGKVLDKFKMAKHFVIDITEDSFTYSRNQESIPQESALDGIYVIRTSVRGDTLSSEETVRAYKGLSSAERAFRSLKTVDLQIRPIYHYKSARVKGHVLLCMPAYYVEWHMRQALAPILFDDHDPEGAQAARSSVVAPAAQSDAARSKLATRKTNDGLPLHSFKTLMEDLATVTKNTVRFPGVEREAHVFATPNPVQRRALDLLGVNLRL
ncbi:MAG: IS1634 family transposase [Pseudomonadota bacterium]